MSIDRLMDKEDVVHTYTHTHTHTHTREYYSAIKNKVFPYAATCVDWRALC